ncbi:ORC2-domain-containing protein [Saccharata proteae CBS 121410]|uniref:Origin recognition complex subunit 2 n=1 Tax=Saccharata proteae CBS 121410 TaxID=1314787 RepID=A0A9P4HS71_9PEZI|nr:ORC2-domain-containing protein [Saccharata proteae CBS 121410]
MPSAKRRRPDEDDDITTTPKKIRPSPEAEDDEDEIANTPSKKSAERPQQIRRGRPRKNPLEPNLVKELYTNTVNGATNGLETPRSQRRVLFATPTKPRDEDPAVGTPTIVRNADRSARRKSNRRMIERTIHGDQSDEELGEDDILARRIWSDEEEDELGAEKDTQEVAAPAEPAITETPTKRRRGRPRKERPPERSPTPPERLPAHEKYFWANRPGGTKTSNNTLSSRLILNHDEYFSQMQSYPEDHEEERAFLHELHSRSFDQWIYELDNGFNICLYGYGSKQALTTDFASHLYTHLANTADSKGTPKIIMVNGYEPTLTPKDILTTILSTLVPTTLKLPSQPSALLPLLLAALSSAATQAKPGPLTLILNSIDAIALRRSATQSLLATLASHPSIHLLATADTPNFALLWDASLRSQYRFLFHDCTTFVPFGGREVDVVETFNELLGRSSRRVGGRDGVGFVLRSLPENARDLFRILVAEQLAAAAEDDDGVFGAGMDEEDGEEGMQVQAKGRRKGVETTPMGIEYRVLYNKSTEQFVCSGEVAFRTLLKEFHDHQMIESRKDGAGVERLWVPFRREDLESLLEELVG